MRILRGVAALFAVGAILIGGPWALIGFGRLDALTRLGGAQLLSSAADGSLVLGIVTVIGWVAWLLAAGSLAGEAIAQFSAQRWRPRLPGVRMFSPVSALLIAAILGLLGNQAVDPGPAQANTYGGPETGSPIRTGAPASPADETVERPAESGITHRVVPGDDLWTLAERYLGDGSRWREILAANDTVLLDATQVLQPGMVLHIPGATGNQPAAQMVEVAAGDTLSALAAQHLGDAGRWPELLDANRSLIADPDAIDIGWRLRLPGPATAGTNPADGPDPGRGPAGTDSPSQTPLGADHRPAGENAALFDGCPAPATPPEEPAELASESPAAANSWVPALPTSLGLTLSAGLATAFALRRRQQQAVRPLGRRLPPLGETAARAGAMLAAVLHPGGSAGDPAAQPAGVPAPSGAAAGRFGWVPIGMRAGEPVGYDPTAHATISLCSPDDAAVSMATAMVLSLTSAYPEADLTVLAAGPCFAWLASLDDPRLVTCPSPAAGLKQLAGLAAERRAGRPPGADLVRLRGDPELGAAWAPTILLLPDTPPGELPSDLAELGLTVLACGPLPGAEIEFEVAEGSARMAGSGEWFVPHLVELPARRVLADLFETAGATGYPPAPWWADQPETDQPVESRPVVLLPVAEELPMISSVDGDHPVLLLLGPVELVGARGTMPSRSVKQCAEYCAWLLENPGRRPSEMAEALMVAETTRRSNMSRLRSWLGQAPDGSAYLPDAYSGRIELHAGITSDWERLQTYLHGGANRAGDEALISALALVRGSPLADVAPGQWRWAEQLRADMTATIRDAAVVLARRGLDRGDVTRAAWAISRAEAANPDDTLLMALRIRVAHLRDDPNEVDRLVLHLTRTARNLGVDLSEEVVSLLQEVVEGRVRLRRA